MTLTGRLLSAIREPGFRQRLMLVLVITAIIDIPLWAYGVFSRSFTGQTVYCFGISVSTFLLIDLGRNLWPASAGPEYWPRGWRLAVHNTLGVITGYVIGISLGDWTTGHSTLDFLLSGPRQAASVLVSLAIAMGFIYFFYQRARFEELRREATEAQLLLLQSQLEPHMLFNTLANLRALIAADPARAIVLLDHLNDFLRATLGASRAGTHAVAREFDLLRDYLEIMAVRMGERLRYTLELGAGSENLPIPALLLQPLVENSIRHGLEPKPEGGELRITATRSGDQLVFEVLDTGVGLKPAPAASGGASEGFGLAHVRERLQSRFGARASFRLSGHGSAGTLARVVLPVME
jgi:hypothetical protein